MKLHAPKAGAPGAKITLDDASVATIWSGHPYTGHRWATLDATGEMAVVRMPTRYAPARLATTPAREAHRRVIAMADRVLAEGIACVEHLGEPTGYTGHYPEPRKVTVWCHLPLCPDAIDHKPYTGWRWTRFEIIDIITGRAHSRTAPRLCATCIDHA